jgi:hypothetical protein
LQDETTEKVGKKTTIDKAGKKATRVGKKAAKDQEQTIDKAGKTAAKDQEKTMKKAGKEATKDQEKTMEKAGKAGNKGTKDQEKTMEKADKKVTKDQKQRMENTGKKATNTGTFDGTMLQAFLDKAWEKLSAEEKERALLNINAQTTSLATMCSGSGMAELAHHCLMTSVGKSTALKHACEMIPFKCSHLEELGGMSVSVFNPSPPPLSPYRISNRTILSHTAVRDVKCVRADSRLFRISRNTYMKTIFPERRASARGKFVHMISLSGATNDSFWCHRRGGNYRLSFPSPPPMAPE